MKISDAIAKLVAELHERGNVDVALETPSDRCDRHNHKQPCPYCDLCAHGKALTQHCDVCAAAADLSWMDAPLSDDEIDQVERWFDGYRYGPTREKQMPRVYIDYHVALGPLVTRELRRLRRELHPAAAAVDPSAADTGTPSTRD